MKRLLVIVSLIFVGVAANAQWYTGGSLNIWTTANSNDDGDKQNTITRFGLAPEVGFYISDKFDVGLDLGVGTEVNKDHTTDTKTTASNWSISPYVRYSFLQFGDFELIGKGAASIGGRKRADDTKLVSMGLNITPILAYNLNEHFTLLTSLNFVSFGINSVKVIDGDIDNTIGFNFNSNNVATLGDITVGFIYKF